MVLRTGKDGRGILLMVLACLCFSVMDVLAKITVRQTGVWELAFARGALSSFIVLLYLEFRYRRLRNLSPEALSRRGDALSLHRAGALRAGLTQTGTITIRERISILLGHSRGLLLSRGLLGGASLACYLYALGHLSLADTAMLTKSSPIFVILLSWLFLKERITWAHILALLASLAGVWLILRPDFSIRSLAGFAGLASAFLSASAYLSIRRIAQTDAPEVVVLYFTGFSALLPLPFVISDLHTFPMHILLLLLGVGVAGSAAQLLMTLAFQTAPASKVSIATYSAILFAVIWGALLFGEVQDAHAMAGSVLVVSSCMVLPFIGSSRKTAGVKPPTEAQRSPSA